MQKKWHPVGPIIASVSSFGNIYIWAAKHEENWSAFAPDFLELEENLEYEEKEDEFDVVRHINYNIDSSLLIIQVPDEEKTKLKNVDEDITVDVTTCEPIQAFIDSDDEQDKDEVLYLSTLPYDDEDEFHRSYSSDDDLRKKSNIKKKLLKKKKKSSTDLSDDRPRKLLKK